ncbi:Maf family protein [Leucothrix pacifica]|uniref:7-methyl-GTP pyrophosphatase n=1 Tax=Leucothrix pacifica TaxID=1247513 RepID=A0A317CKQ3_9GAMM|nr:nucleoside triphosphate pyrophosphatase [Leucothrix pacifica]PWQ99138.1 septum formation inhibitor Maf [Leucothrix pacifica]
MYKLVLASSSPYRKTLLERLQQPFVCDSPDIDESQQLNETPRDYVERLSKEKAEAVAARHPDSLIIASDQCSVIDNVICGKPGHHSAAIQQLQQSSGNRVSFYTGLCIMNSNNHETLSAVIPFHVDFRDLTLQEIERYLNAEKPYDCAGSFKAEGLGVTLFKKMEGDDPNALIGLPLIRLCEMLRQFGLNLP